jgi:branched-chain amino acid aminotransferase
VIYLNGTIIPADQARIDPFDRGFSLGDGLFETLRAYEGRPFRLADHLDRMATAAAVLGIPLPFDMQAVAEAVKELLRVNGQGQGDASIRITLTRGTGPRGLAPPDDPHPTLLIATAAYRPLSETCTAVSIDIRRNEGSPLSKMKTLGALDNVVAAGAAGKRGAEEAILSNNAGSVVCGARANLFAVIDGRLVTPPVSDGVLPGIARQIVLEVAAAQGISCAETSLRPADLLRAQEILLTNSLFEIRSVARLDERAYPGHVFAEKLRTGYREMTII